MLASGAWSSAACALAHPPTSLAALGIRIRTRSTCDRARALPERRICAGAKIRVGLRSGFGLGLGLGFGRGRIGVCCGVKGDGDGRAGPSVEEREVEVVETGEEDGEGAGEGRVWLTTDLKARLYLVLVPFLWGTYGPALRFIYSQPHAPSASIITLSRKVASVVFFLLLQPLENAVKKSSSENVYNGSGVSGEESKAGSSWGAAAELGFWTFLGTALQTNALGSTTATRAGFILQTITVIVPLISAVSGSHVSKITWGSAFLALTGVALMSAVGNEGAAGGSISSLLCSEGSAGCQSALMGDLEVLAAAFFYAINTIRLGVHAKKMSALDLSTRVMVVSTVCTCVWAGYDYATATLDGRDGGLAWQGLTSPEVLGATIFAALVPGTLAHLAQAVGQKTIPPSEAQVYYSLQPVWAALYSAVLLHESMSPLAWGAGCLIVFAALLAGTQNS
ncbi:hypothetical protein M758_UG102300 [Ceratodon purpureus]|nr:hypothetical protein M758_UG102300 [Ceratodon purpureus]